MSDCTNSGCSCTPNHAIKCEVTSCANHCQNQQYCGLNAINPSMDQCTDCQSFRKK